MSEESSRFLVEPKTPTKPAAQSENATDQKKSLRKKLAEKLKEIRRRDPNIYPLY
jgi:hypothetical protein